MKREFQLFISANIIVFLSRCYCIAASICHKCIFSHIVSTVFNFTCFVFFSNLLHIQFSDTSDNIHL
nr:MAG TPA: hypothetical protein [Caudoviricetes sp.]